MKKAIVDTMRDPQRVDPAHDVALPTDSLGPITSRRPPSLDRETSASTSEWRALLNRDGQPRQLVANVVSFIEAHPRLKDAFSFDEFANRVLITSPLPWVHGRLPAQWTDADRIELQLHIQMLGFPVTKDSIVQDGVLAVARRRRFHPVRTFLNSLEWDKKERLSDWLTEYCHADVGDPDRKRYVQAVGRATLVSAVARVMAPGCKVDSVLTLLGPQGWRKSTAIAVLSEPWTTDSMPDLHTKDAAIQLQGVWLVEMSELSSVNRSAVENTKAFISRPTDRFRPPYGRNAEDCPRQCIFIATTNTSAFLRDESGNRRFWPVRLTAPIDVDALRGDRNQLWAEAYQAFISGEKWHLSPDLEKIAMAEQELRRAPNPLEELLDERLEVAEDEITMMSLLKDVAGFDHDTIRTESQRAGAVARQIAELMSVRGWEQMKPKGRARSRRVVFRRPPNSQASTSE